MKKITENTILADVLKISDCEKVLRKYKFPCLGCFFAQYEAKSLKIGQVCKMYKIDAKSLIKDINKNLEK